MVDDAVQRALRAEFSRRRFLKASAFGLLAGPTLAACAGGASPSPTPGATQVATPGASASQAWTDMGPIVVNVQTGDRAKTAIAAWCVPFEQETGIKVTPDEREPTIEVLRAGLEAGQVPVDFYDGLPYGIPSADYAKYLEPIDYNIVDRSQFIEGMTFDYTVGTTLFSVVIGYNKNTTGGKIPESWADVFDLAKFPGKRSIEDGWGTACMVALLADGVSPDKLFPLDVDRALKKLATIKSDIVWYSGGAQIQDLQTSGEVGLGTTWNGRAKLAGEANSAAGAVWNQQILNYDLGGVIKGTKHKEAAMRYLAFMTSAEHAMGLTTPPPTCPGCATFPYPVANKNAEPDPAVKEWLPTSHLDVAYVIADRVWLDENSPTYDPMFQEFKAS